MSSFKIEDFRKRNNDYLTQQKPFTDLFDTLVYNYLNSEKFVVDLFTNNESVQIDKSSDEENLVLGYSKKYNLDMATIYAKVVPTQGREKIIQLTITKIDEKNRKFPIIPGAPNPLFNS